MACAGNMHSQTGNSMLTALQHLRQPELQVKEIPAGKGFEPFTLPDMPSH